MRSMNIEKIDRTTSLASQRDLLEAMDIGRNYAISTLAKLLACDVCMIHSLCQDLAEKGVLEEVPSQRSAKAQFRYRLAMVKQSPRC